MPVLLLPDLLAISFLTVVVALIRRKFKYEHAGIWTMGLYFIVVECVARMLYLADLPPLWHQAMHAAALSAYVLAGASFLRSALPELRRLPHNGVYLAINVAPHLLLMILYGLESTSGMAYRLVTVGGLAIGLVSAAVLRRGWRHLLGFSIIWTPLILATIQADSRSVVYLSLSLMYGLIALGFSATLPPESKGRLLIVGGFCSWSLCFLTHPWVAQRGGTALQLANEVWDMQKFLITLGFMLMLFERQVWTTEWLALHDDLTGLPNRRLFDDRLANAVARAEREGTGLLLFNMDLDGFKTVNDTLGHDAGDALLRQIGKNLLTMVRKTDTLARMGGDEFTLLAIDLHSWMEEPREAHTGMDAEPLSEEMYQAEKESEVPSDGFGWQTVFPFSGEGLGTSASQAPKPTQQMLQHYARTIAANLRRAVELPVMLEAVNGSQALRISTSIGYALYPFDSTDTAELCRIADRRMYQDKQVRDRRQHPVLDRMLALLSV